MENLLIVITTFSSRKEAEKMAKEVVECRLVACAQLSSNIKSFYWWNKNIESNFEIKLEMKTTELLYGRLEDFLRNNHSYETPEIIAIPIANINEDYGEWIVQETDSGRE